MIPPEVSGIFGDSWRSNFEERIQVLTGGAVKYWKGNGSSLFYTYNAVAQAYALTAPADDQTTLSYNSTTTFWTVTQKDGTQRIFNNAGYLTSIVDRNSNTTTISVDAAHQNRIASVTDPSGHVLTFNYTNATFPRLCTRISDAVGTFTQYAYDTLGRLSQVAYPDGSKYNFQFNDPNSNTLITLVTDSQNKTIEAHTYDSQRRGATSSQANDANGNPVNKVTVNYAVPYPWQNQVCDSTFGNCTTIQVTNRAQRHYLGLTTGSASNGCASCSFVGHSSSTLTDSGYLNSFTDANGNEKFYTYDAQGNTLSVSVRDYFTGLNDTWNYTYNSFGEVLTATDPLGAAGDPNHTTVNAYDAHGNLLSVTTPPPDSSTAASVTSFTPNAHGQITQIQDPLLNQTKIVYCTQNQSACPYGLIYTLTDALSKVTTYTYDGRGNRLSVKDAAGKITQFQYDAMNRVTLITYPTSPATTVQSHYDWRGRRDYVIDQNSHRTTYGYDDADRMTSVTDAQTPTAGVTTYKYDTENDLTDIYDANSNHTQFFYFPGAELYKTTFPSGYSENYSFDGNNNLAYKTDRNGNSINYQYDNQDRLVYKSYSGGGTFNYTYDPAGRLQQILDTTTGTYTFNYDNMNRLASTVTDYNFDTAGALTVGYAYDAASNRKTMTDPQNLRTAYTYDVLNRLATLAFNVQTPAFGFGYDALSRRTSLTRPNGVNTSYTYDAVSNLLSVLHKLGTTTLDGASYTYDPANNRKTRTDNRTNVTLTYAYDNLYQLLSAKQGTTTKETYTYDPVGNRLSSLGVSPYVNNTSNELTSTPSASYTYDNNGNTLTKSGGTMYGWDAENRLTSAVVPGTGTVTFKYDPSGRRIQKSSPLGTVNYIYDGPNLLEELDGSGNVLAKYTQDLGVDQPLAELRSGTTSYYQQDGVGSVTALSNPAGALANTYTYDSYGKLAASTGTIVNQFRYTGREFDGETGLYYYRARYYDPTAGRFSGQDPLRFGSGTNFYSYANNSPTTLNDPSGEAVNIGLQGNTITVSASIGVYGPRASAALAQQWQDGINNYWNNFGNNFHLGKCKVVFNVTVSNEPGVNWWWSLPSGLDDWVYVPNVDQYRSNTTASFWGYWAYDLSPFGAAHEFGHMASLSDYYDYDSNGRLVPDKNRPNDIMSVPDGSVSQQDINDIVGYLRCHCK
jgi:RHS repeat-associated protein